MRKPLSNLGEGRGSVASENNIELSLPLFTSSPEFDSNFSLLKTPHISDRTWENRAGSDPKASSLSTSSHNAIKFCVSCQGKKTVNSPTQLSSLYTTMTRHAKLAPKAHSNTYTLGIAKSYLIGLKVCSAGRNSWYYKPSQMTMAGGTIVPSRESTAASFLSQHNSNCILNAYPYSHG